MDERYTLIDGYAQQAAYPETWAMPDVWQVATLQIGDFIKIGVQFDPDKKHGEDPEIRRLWEAKIGTGVNSGGERFWLKLSAIGDQFCGEVDNDLIYTAHHGLRRGDLVTVERRHILDAEVGDVKERLRD